MSEKGLAILGSSAKWQRKVTLECRKPAEGPSRGWVECLWPTAECLGSVIYCMSPGPSSLFVLCGFPCRVCVSILPAP